MFRKARENTKQYHRTLYKNARLFKKGSWLERPEPDILSVGRKLSAKHNLCILDVGSGVGRNAIPLAEMLHKNGVEIICVDYLDIAIRKLNEYAEERRISEYVSGYVLNVEDFQIEKNRYDFIFSHGVLAHVRDKKTLLRILRDIARGVKAGGYVYLSIQSDLVETVLKTKRSVEPLVEVHLTAGEVKNMYRKIFTGWTVTVLREDPYTEYYMENDRKIEWKCVFVVLVAQKN